MGRARKKLKRRKMMMLKIMLRRFALFLLCIVAIYVVAAENVQVKFEKAESIEVGTEEKKYEKVQATLFGCDISKYVKVENRVNTKKLGDYEIEYSIFFKKYTKKVSVIDTQSPTIELIGKKKIYVGNINEYSEKGYTVTDNYDNNITAKEVKTELCNVAENHYVMKYEVTDSSGNKGTAERDIFISDTIVYLTFDDGPGVKVTPKILDLLLEHDIKATFFVLRFKGNKEKEELIQRMYNEGHTIGLHGYSHEYPEIYSSLDNITNNFYKLKEDISELTGYNSKIIRFPGGSSNTISRKYKKGIMTKAAKKLEKEGFVYFDWSLDSDDAGSAKTSEEISLNVISNLKENAENVVLMHDSNTHEQTYEALKEIIKCCEEKGYIFKALKSDVTPVRHKINN
ncbi:MAG: polysaccharide deacetylase family protein [Clostridia bacterium]|nr:polysaccharide deacetylase family protein [Clostridia bacterium]